MSEDLQTKPASVGKRKNGTASIYDIATLAKVSPMTVSPGIFRGRTGG